MPVSVLRRMSADTVMNINAYVDHPTPNNATGTLKISMPIPIRDLMAALSAKYLQHEDTAAHPLELAVPHSTVYELGNAAAAGFQVVPPTTAVPPQDAPGVADAEDDALEATQQALEHGGRWCQWVATQGFAKTRALHTQVHKSIAINAQGRRMGRSV